MTLQKKGKYWYGSTIEDVQEEALRYSKRNVYTATKFAYSICPCGSQSFRLESDEEEGAARRICCECEAIVLMGDSDEFAADATFENHICVCDGRSFGLLSAVALYDDSNDVRWYYIGCLCRSCGLVGVFADWKCEAGDAEVFLSKT